MNQGNAAHDALAAWERILAMHWPERAIANVSSIAMVIFFIVIAYSSIWSRMDLKSAITLLGLTIGNGGIHLYQKWLITRPYHLIEKALFFDTIDESGAVNTASIKWKFLAWRKI